MPTSKLNQMTLTFPKEVIMQILFLFVLNSNQFFEHFLLKLNVPRELIMICLHLTNGFVLLLNF